MSPREVIPDATEAEAAATAARRAQELRQGAAVERPPAGAVDVDEVAEAAVKALEPPPRDVRPPDPRVR